MSLWGKVVSGGCECCGGDTDLSVQAMRFRCMRCGCRYSYYLRQWMDRCFRRLSQEEREKQWQRVVDEALKSM